MKKSFLFLLFICRTWMGYGQDTITIEECYRLAFQNYPLVQRYDLIARSEAYDVSNASKAYLPQFSLTAKATYQTDVTRLPISLPGYEVPVLSKDQYQVVAEVSQFIWDGGATRANRESIKAQGETDRQQFEVDMYAVRERINQLFFGILLLDQQILLSDLYLDDLAVNYDRIASYRENGVASQSDVDAVHVEQLSARQSRIQLRANRTAYLHMLSAFIGQPLGENTHLQQPDVFEDPVTGRAYNRPEMKLYDAMQRQAQTRRLAIRASQMPQLGVFVQGGYGKPGLNMLQDKFKAFAIGGVRLSWNFGSFYTRRNNLLNIENTVRLIDVQRETFLFNNDLQQTQLESEYRKYREVMAYDDQIIQLRGNIVRASQAKLENGTISVTDLMRDLISEQNAKLNKAVHQIELLQQLYGIKNLTNN